MNWRFSLFLLLMFGVLAAFSLAPWNEFLCKQPLVIDLLKQNNKDGAIGCFEFWLNRYQALVGTFAAVVAATAAWFASQGQIRAARHQAEIGNQQYAAAALPVLQDHLSRLNNADSLMEQLAIRYNNVRTKIFRTKTALEAAYKRDGDKIGSQFGLTIHRLDKYDNSFDQAVNEFDAMHIQAMRAGNETNAGADIIREQILNCYDLNNKKHSLIHAYVGYETLFDACKRGDIEQADLLWLDLCDEDISSELVDVERPMLRKAQERAFAKIEIIVRALIS